MMFKLRNNSVLLTTNTWLRLLKNFRPFTLLVALLSVQVFADSPLHDHEVMRFREAISEHMPGYKQELDTEWDAIVIFKKASEWSYNPDSAPQEVKEILSDWQNYAQRYLADLIAGILLGNGFKNGVVDADLNNYERNTYYDSAEQISTYTAFDRDMEVDYLYSSAPETLLSDHVNAVNQLFRGKQRYYEITLEREMDIANKCNNICSNIVNKPLQNQARLAVQATPSELKNIMAATVKHLSNIKNDDLRKRAIDDVLKVCLLERGLTPDVSISWLKISEIDDEFARNIMAEIFESEPTQDKLNDKSVVFGEFWNTPDDLKMHMIDYIISNHPLYNSFKGYLQEIESGIEHGRIDDASLLTRAKTAVDSAPLKAKEQVARAWMIFCLGLEDEDMREQAIKEFEKADSAEEKEEVISFWNGLTPEIWKHLREIHDRALCAQARNDVREAQFWDDQILGDQKQVVESWKDISKMDAKIGKEAVASLRRVAIEKKPQMLHAWRFNLSVIKDENLRNIATKDLEETPVEHMDQIATMWASDIYELAKMRSHYMNYQIKITEQEAAELVKEAISDIENTPTERKRGVADIWRSYLSQIKDKKLRNEAMLSIKEIAKELKDYSMINRVANYWVGKLKTKQKQNEFNKLPSNEKNNIVEKYWDNPNG